MKPSNVLLATEGTAKLADVVSIPFHSQLPLVVPAIELPMARQSSYGRNSIIDTYFTVAAPCIRRDQRPLFTEAIDAECRVIYSSR